MFEHSITSQLTFDGSWLFWFSSTSLSFLVQGVFQVTDFLQVTELLKVRLSSLEEKIGIVINNTLCQFSFHSYVRRFHVYKSVWSPLIAEQHLDCKHAEGNEHDEYDAAVNRNDLVNEFTVGHLPFHFPRATCTFLNSLISQYVTVSLGNM